MPNLTPLLGHTLEELKQIATQLGLPAFVGKQMADWLYKKRVTSIEEMRNLSKVAREKLKAAYTVGASQPVEGKHSVDGTSKYPYNDQRRL
ncbi:MAG: hypothetical protein ACLS29_07090 [Prevotellamassilia sp.]